MQLEGLEVLEAVVVTGSFVRAGRRIGLTQSGVSRAIARLEERIGVRLLDRNARAVTLTDEGRRFYEQVAPLMSALEDAFDATGAAKDLVRGKLRVNVDTYFARAYLGSAIHRFLTLYPAIELDLVARDHADNFIAEGFDIALRFGEPAQQGLIARLLWRTRIVTCAAPEYLKRAGRPKHPRELTTHECIQFRDPATGHPFDWEFHKGRRVTGVQTRGRLLVNDGSVAIATCLAGFGIAQPMEFAVHELIKSGDLVELFPDWNGEMFPLYALYPSKLHPPAKVRAFLDFVTKLKT